MVEQQVKKVHHIEDLAHYPYDTTNDILKGLDHEDPFILLTNEAKTIVREYDRSFKLFDQIKQRHMMNMIVKDLCTYLSIEHDIIYPIARFLIINEQQEQYDRDVRRMMEIVKELYHMDPSDSHFSIQSNELYMLLKEHVKREESQVFPALKEKLDHSELRQYFEIVKCASECAPDYPHENWLKENHQLQSLFDDFEARVRYVPLSE